MLLKYPTCVVTVPQPLLQSESIPPGWTAGKKRVCSPAGSGNGDEREIWSAAAGRTRQLQHAVEAVGVLRVRVGQPRRALQVSGHLILQLQPAQAPPRLAHPGRPSQPKKKDASVMLDTGPLECKPHC